LKPAERRKHASVEEYLAQLTLAQRNGHRPARAALRAGLPAEAEEVLSYQILGFRQGRGRPVVWVAAFADHFSVYPYTDRMRDELGPQIERDRSGKGTIKLPADEPLPLPIVTRVAKILVERARE
jgi:uncharacterized protein YdhG (YjbR/CyaY superfamily)